VIVAATVLGSFMPNTLLSAGTLPGRAVAFLTEEPPTNPIGCLDASCGRGAPAPAPVPLTVAAICTAVSGLLILAAMRIARRCRADAATLPRGTAQPLFHPPRFS
jgi:hypothetical protein